MAWSWRAAGKPFLWGWVGGLFGGIFGVLLFNLWIPLAGTPPPAGRWQNQNQSAARPLKETAFNIAEAKKSLLPLYPSRALQGASGKAAGYGLALTSDGLVGVFSSIADPSKLKIVSADRRIFSLRTAAKKPGERFSIPELGLAFYTLQGQDQEKAALQPFALANYEQVRVGDLLFEFRDDGGIRAHRITATYSTRLGSALESSEAVFPSFFTEDELRSGIFLFDVSGRLVGLTRQGGEIIAAEFLQKALRQYLDAKIYQATWLGVNFSDLNRAPPASDQPTFGLLLKGAKGRRAVAPKSPAQTAGLKEGDVLISFDRRRLDGTLPFPLFLQRYPPGAEVEIGIMRAGAEKTVRVVLGAQ